jgi:predicted O-methyltransferase YrrM
LNGKGHGIHSPFVFDFVKNILNDRKTINCAKDIESRRQFLLNWKEIIEVEDFGAGSSIIKKNKRSIHRIAATSLKPKKYAQLIHRIIAYYKPKQIIEIGTSFGITTAYIAKANPIGIVNTFEGSASIANIAYTNFYALQVNNVTLHQGEFSRTLPVVLNGLDGIDFAFIDGNHQKNSTLQYFELLLHKSSNNTIFIFDDIHWSAGMESAWSEIKNHPQVQLTIDLFFIGLVFLKKEFKEAQHFTIRF